MTQRSVPPVGQRHAAIMLDMDAIRTHHREQRQPNYCVPACVCMTLSRLGRDVQQDEICAGWHRNHRGYALEDAAHLFAKNHEMAYFDPRESDAATTRGWMRLQAQLSRWTIAQMFASEMEGIARAMQPAPVSRFGPMSSGELSRIHAIVVVGTDRMRVHYLDPYYPAAGQPFSMTNADFYRAFQLSAFAVAVE